MAGNRRPTPLPWNRAGSRATLPSRYRPQPRPRRKACRFHLGKRRPSSRANLKTSLLVCLCSLLKTFCGCRPRQLAPQYCHAKPQRLWAPLVRQYSIFENNFKLMFTRLFRCRLPQPGHTRTERGFPRIAEASALSYPVLSALPTSPAAIRLPSHPSWRLRASCPLQRGAPRCGGSGGRICGRRRAGLALDPSRSAATD